LARYKQRVCSTTKGGLQIKSYITQIRAVIEAQGIKIYTPPVEEDDEALHQHARSLMAAMPFAVIGSERM